MVSVVSLHHLFIVYSLQAAINQSSQGVGVGVGVAPAAAKGSVGVAGPALPPQQQRPPPCSTRSFGTSHLEIGNSAATHFYIGPAEDFEATVSLEPPFLAASSVIKVLPCYSVS